MELLAMETILPNSLIGTYGDRAYTYRVGLNPGVPKLTFLGRNRGVAILPGTVFTSKEDFMGNIKISVVGSI